MKISIVMPVFNGAAHVSGALESLLGQDFKDWEAVIVDDGSTDATASVVEGYAARDGRIRLVRQKNGGVSVARNRGIDEARGEWVAWLDADDLYVPDALSSVAALIDAHPRCSCFQFPYLEISRTGEGDRLCGSAAYSLCGGCEYSGVEAFDILFARIATAGMNWQPWRFVWRRGLLPRFRTGIIHEDVDVLPLGMAVLDRVFISGKPFYRYLPARAGAATESFTPRRVDDILDVTSHVYSCLAASPLPEDVRRGFRSMLAVNLFGYYLATPGFAEPDCTRLLDAFAAHPQWLEAIRWPPKTAWLKRLFLRTLGVRNTARLVGRLTSYKGFHKLSK
ncbi:MAG: glycosyltransferase family 2 protein [Kiritimatiellae bacterium]|nr:glycosyltransferase family 2 protein [Kiritimatiellia bacterium]